MIQAPYSLSDLLVYSLHITSQQHYNYYCFGSKFMSLNTIVNKSVNLEIYPIAKAGSILKATNPELSKLIEKHSFKDDDLCFLAKYGYS